MRRGSRLLALLRLVVGVGGFAGTLVHDPRRILGGDDRVGDRLIQTLAGVVDLPCLFAPELEVFPGEMSRDFDKSVCHSVLDETQWRKWV